MIQVSMIIPVYNAEKFLETMLETVVNQTLRDIEIILIDDGSQDRSGEICDSYAERDERIRVIHQENAGMCAARNLAMSMAEGEYIAFADNDDVMELDLLEKAPVDEEHPYEVIAGYIQKKGLHYQILLALADQYYNYHTVLRLAHTASMGGTVI